ncbi:MAG TPA: Ig-like domain-containing protein [Gemmatimonadales bacterium]|nr:Ig-like domain-containing protein [Gemmatimonadales bacterium]
MHALAGLAVVAFAGPVAAQNVADLQVTPEALTLKVGETKSLFPQAYDANQNIVVARFQYFSQKPGVARVDGEGRVTGISPGSTQITVRAGRKSAPVSVLVSPGDNPPPAEPAPAPRNAAPQPITLPPAPAGTQQIVIDPATVYLLQSESDHLVARALAADGSVLGQMRVIWRSLTPAVVSVIDSLNGDVVGATPGMGTIQATGPAGLIATAPVQVVATSTAFESRYPRMVLSPDQIDTMEMVVPSQSGRKIETSLTYASSNPGVVLVGPTGILQAKSPGQSDITVTGYFQARHVTVIVHRPISYFLTDPPSGGQVTVPLDGFRSLTAKAEAADSTLIPEAPLRWKVADTSLARYDTAAGRIIGRKEGLTTLTLTVRGYVPKVWGLRIVPGGIGLDHHVLGLVIGTSADLSVELRDAQGQGYGPAPEVTWTSDHPDVAKVADGKVTAVGPGSALIIASVPWGKADTAKVFSTGDLLLASDRASAGISGLYEATLHAPVNLLRLLTAAFPATDPALSPDRMRIAYSARGDGTDFDIWVMDADGRNAHPLTNDSAAEVHPSWTPDGKALVYSIIGKDRDQLWLNTFRDRRPLTIEKVSASAPAVSPDGKWVAYVGGKERKKPDVFLRGLARDTTIQVTETKQKETAVGWFPNGDLAWVTEATDGSRGYEVLRMTLGTTQRTVVATSAYPILDFAISRDGGTIAYVTEEPNPGNKQQRTKTVLYLGAVTPGSAPQAVALPTSETVGSPAF